MAAANEQDVRSIINSKREEKIDRAYTKTVRQLLIDLVDNHLAHLEKQGKVLKPR